MVVVLCKSLVLISSSVSKEAVDVNVVNVVTHAQLPAINISRCEETSTFVLPTRPVTEVFAVICQKQGDTIISAALHQSGSWEANIVTALMRAMVQYPDAVFIGAWCWNDDKKTFTNLLSDAGCNIGAFTLPMASLGRRVVAVDMMADNLAFIRHSLGLATHQGEVTLVHNAVTDVSGEVVVPGRDTGGADPGHNPGSKMAVAREQLGEAEALGPPVTTVTLTDLMRLAPAPTYIIKMDIQGRDCQVTTCFFDMQSKKFI